MDSLKHLLGVERYQRYFKYYNAEDFANWGLGMMYQKDREELLNTGAIKTIDDVDCVTNDGWCVNVYTRDEPKCVYMSDRFNCEQEVKRIKEQRPSAKVEIKNYSKLYVEYLKKKNYTLSKEQISLQDLTKDFGGEVLPDF